jgi:hypothetical protein
MVAGLTAAEAGADRSFLRLSFSIMRMGITKTGKEAQQALNGSIFRRADFITHGSATWAAKWPTA